VPLLAAPPPTPPQIHPCWVRYPDRPEEVSDVLPQTRRTNQQIGGGGEPPTWLRCSKRKKRVAVVSGYHRAIGARIGQRPMVPMLKGRGAPTVGLSRQHRRRQFRTLKPEAVAHASRAGAEAIMALEREWPASCRASSIRAGRWDGTCPIVGPDHARLRPGPKAPAGKARILGEGIPQ